MKSCNRYKVRRSLLSGISLALICSIINIKSDVGNAAVLGRSQRNDEESIQTCQDICKTDTCVLEAISFAKIMNENADPCEDFYEFVCGNFIQEKIIDDQVFTVNTFSIAQTEISREIYNEIRDEIKPSDLSAFKKAKYYYRNCMNQSRVDQEGVSALLKILDNIGGWPLLLGSNSTEGNFDWTEYVYKIRDQKFITFFPIIAAVSVDKRNSSNHIIKIYNADTVISRTFLIDGPDNKLQKAYHEYMVNVSVALGANSDMALTEMKKVLKLEIDLYNLQTPTEELMNKTKIDNYMTIKDLSDKYPSIPWLKLLNKIFNPSGISVNETETVYVADPAYISKIEGLINNTPKSVLANYLAWKVVYLTLMYMPDALRKMSLEFENVIDGTKTVMNRQSWCVNELMEAFPVSLSAMYIRTYLNRQIKEESVGILLNVKKQIQRTLQEVDWIDNETRRAALEKLDAISFSIGYADELMDDQKVNEYYKELEINSGNYLDSAFNITVFLEKQNYRSLRNQTVSKNVWTMNQNVALVNAYTVLQRNIIEIPAGFLRSFFRSDRPQYLNYGAIGTVVGHEIIHSFDNEGRKYDKNGNQHNWWQASTEEKFFKKAQCFVDQYNNFTVPEVGLKVNGVLTQGENIADNGGFKAAYLAYRDWANRNNVIEPCLPFLNFTQAQLFWISAASNWCSKQRPEHVKNLIATGKHSPNNARIIISFSNIKEFSRDFNCKVGSRMNPEKKCIIW